MSRSVSYHPTSRSMALALAVVMGAACSESPVAPLSVVETTPAAIRHGGHSESAPASVGWNEQARTLVAAGRLNPLAAARALAALGVAQYRAVSAVGHGKPTAQRGAVAGASAQVLKFLFPAAADSLEARVTRESIDSKGRVDKHFMLGVDIGREAGDALVQRAQNDRFTTPWTGTVPTGTGMWKANGAPVGATFGGVEPYILRSGDQFRPPPPPAFGSQAFLTDLNEIATFAVNRTAEQQAIAVKWNYATGTYTPPGYWNLVTSDYVQEFELGERAATHAFALTAVATMDALIGCWDAKYFYWLIRPSQANSAITLSFALPNHPSYPSGHSCGSAAAGKVLAHLFPGKANELDFQVTEAGLSRMYAGIHYRFDIDAGRELGEKVARRAIGMDRHFGLLRAIER